MSTKSALTKRIHGMYSSAMYGVSKIFVPVNDKTIMNDSSWIIRLADFFHTVHRCFPAYSFEYCCDRYIHQIQTAMLSRDTSRKMLQSWLKLFSESNDSEKYFISKLFLKTGLINDEVIRRIMQYASETENALYQYYTALDLSMETFRLSNGIYPEFYNDRKNVMQKIIDRADLKMPVRKAAETRNRKKFCIVVYRLAPTLQNSMQRVVSMVANAMAERSADVRIICLDSCYISSRERKQVYMLFKNPLTVLEQSAVNGMFHENVSVFYSSDVPFTERYQNALNEIYQYNPDAVIEITDELSALSCLYVSDFPVYYIPMRSNASSSFFSYILGSIWKYEEGNKKFHSIDLTQVKQWMFPEYVPPRGAVYTRQDIKIQQDDFVILSIGNNDHVYSAHFVDLLCKTLEENPKLVWLLVGNGASEYLKVNYEKLLKERRVIEWGYEKNLTGLCAVCNIHIRPKMTGGSGATAIACQNGLPVVMPDDVCDPMRWLGRDFSNLHTDEDMIEEILRLYQEPAYYQLQSKRVSELVSKATNAEYWWNQLYDILTEYSSAEKE